MPTEQQITRTKPSLTKAKEMQAEGKGAGSGLDYKPGILAVSIKSDGNKARVLSVTHGREFQTLSTPEHMIAAMFDLAPNRHYRK